MTKKAFEKTLQISFFQKKFVLLRYKLTKEEMNCNKKVEFD